MDFTAARPIVVRRPSLLVRVGENARASSGHRYDGIQAVRKLGDLV